MGAKHHARQTGIGEWSSDELVQFLRTGHNDRAVAGGDMGLAISRSLIRLTPDDTEAMVAYLKAVPTTAGQVSASTDAPATPVTNPALIRTARPRMARCFTRTPARVATASLARAAWIGALRRWLRSAAC